MNCTDVIAYACDGALRCPECAVKAGWTDGGLGEGDLEGVSPVFADSETDSPSHCEACGEYIPEALTGEGVAYVCGELRTYLRAHGDEGAWELLSVWADALRYSGGAAQRIARRFIERGEFYRGVHDLRGLFTYSGGGYAYRFDAAHVELCERAAECGEGESVCAECGAPIVLSLDEGPDALEWVHVESARHDAYPPDPADRWETVIAPEGAYRPLRCEVIDGAPCVVFEREGTGETYAITEVSAHRPTGDAAGA